MKSSQDNPYIDAYEGQYPHNSMAYRYFLHSVSVLDYFWLDYTLLHHRETALYSWVRRCTGGGYILDGSVRTYHIDTDWITSGHANGIDYYILYYIPLYLLRPGSAEECRDSSAWHLHWSNHSEPLLKIKSYNIFLDIYWYLVLPSDISGWDHIAR